MEVPKAHIWIEGDNPSLSRDSRQFGPIPENLVEGTIIYRIWPPSRFGRIVGDSNYYHGRRIHSEVYKPSEFMEMQSFYEENLLNSKEDIIVEEEDFGGDDVK